MRTRDPLKMIGGVSLGRVVIALGCLVAMSCTRVTNEPMQSASTTVVSAAVGPASTPTMTLTADDMLAPGFGPVHQDHG